MSETTPSLAPSGHNYVQIPTAGPARWLAARGERYRQYRHLWTSRPHVREAGPFPLHLDIETTNRCNLQCRMCPRTRLIAANEWAWSPRGLGDMNSLLYKNIVEQAATGGAWSVKLNLLGEPLLHPQLVEQVSLARKLGLDVMLNTNAMLLTPELSRRLIAAGLTDIFFSLDAADRETFERIRVGARFEKVIRNISRFMEIKEASGRVDIQTRATMVTGLASEDDPARQKYRRLIADLGVEEVGFGPDDDHLVDHSAQNIAAYQPGSSRKFVCEQIFQRLFITWDGDIIPCCGHYERQYVLASARQTSLAEAWHGPAAQQLRAAHAGDRFMDIGICRRCSLPGWT